RSGSSTRGGKRRGGLVAQRTVWPAVVVIFPPGCGERPSRRHVVEYLDGQELIAHSAMEALSKTVLPGTARRDVQRLDADLFQPAADRRGDELRPVVATNVPRYTTHREQLSQRIDHVLTGDAASHFQSQTLPRVFVDDREPLEQAARSR